nr:hypothetical protein [Lachnospiraceae bacterium]
GSNEIVNIEGSEINTNIDTKINVNIDYNIDVKEEPIHPIYKDINAFNHDIDIIDNNIINNNEININENNIINEDNIINENNEKFVDISEVNDYINNVPEVPEKTIVELVAEYKPEDIGYIKNMVVNFDIMRRGTDLMTIKLKEFRENLRATQSNKKANFEGRNAAKEGSSYYSEMALTLEDCIRTFENPDSTPEDIQSALINLRSKSNDYIVNRGGIFGGKKARINEAKEMHKTLGYMINTFKEQKMKINGGVGVDKVPMKALDEITEIYRKDHQFEIPPKMDKKTLTEAFNASYKHEQRLIKLDEAAVKVNPEIKTEDLRNYNPVKPGISAKQAAVNFCTRIYADDAFRGGAKDKNIKKATEYFGSDNFKASVDKVLNDDRFRAIHQFYPNNWFEKYCEAIKYSPLPKEEKPKENDTLTNLFNNIESVKNEGAGTVIDKNISISLKDKKVIINKIPKDKLKIDINLLKGRAGKRIRQYNEFIKNISRSNMSKSQVKAVDELGKLSDEIVAYMDSDNKRTVSKSKLRGLFERYVNIEEALFEVDEKENEALFYRKCRKVISKDLKVIYDELKKDKKEYDLTEIFENSRALTVNMPAGELEKKGGDLSERLRVKIEGEKPVDGFFTKRINRKSNEEIFIDECNKLIDPSDKIGNDIVKYICDLNTTSNVKNLMVSRLGSISKANAAEVLVTYLNKEKFMEDIRTALDGDFKNYVKKNNLSMVTAEYKKAKQVFEGFKNDFERAGKLVETVARTKRLTGMNQFMELKGINPKSNIDKRNSAMSVVAELLGVENVLANSKSMNIKIGDKTEKGTFMELATGIDKNNEATVNDINKINMKSFSDPALTKSVADLQILDYICGNLDRHNGNMIYQYEDVVDESGKTFRKFTGVKGIDNDLSFGSKEGVHFNEIKLKDIKIVSKKTADAILNLDPQLLKNMLLGYDINKAEINKIINRLTKAKDAIYKGAKYYRETGDKEINPDHLKVVDDNEIKEISFVGDLAHKKASTGRFGKTINLKIQDNLFSRTYCAMTNDCISNALQVNHKRIEEGVWNIAKCEYEVEKDLDEFDKSLDHMAKNLNAKEKAEINKIQKSIKAYMNASNTANKSIFFDAKNDNNSYNFKNVFDKFDVAKIMVDKYIDKLKKNINLTDEQAKHLETAEKCQRSLNKISGHYDNLKAGFLKDNTYKDIKNANSWRINIDRDGVRIAVQGRKQTLDEPLTVKQVEEFIAEDRRYKAEDYKDEINIENKELYLKLLKGINAPKNSKDYLSEKECKNVIEKIVANNVLKANYKILNGEDPKAAGADANKNKDIKAAGADKKVTDFIFDAKAHEKVRDRAVESLRNNGLWERRIKTEYDEIKNQIKATKNLNGLKEAINRVGYFGVPDKFVEQREKISNLNTKLRSGMKFNDSVWVNQLCTENKSIEGKDAKEFAKNAMNEEIAKLKNNEKKLSQNAQKNQMNVAHNPKHLPGIK